MSSDNTITVSGNVTRDPELRYTTSGRGVTSMGVAVARRYQQNGEWQEETSFMNVTAWADLGENVAASITKGMRVVVTGRLDQRKYTDKEGNERTTFEIIADDVGPSLKWAQAEVKRISKDRDGGGSRGGSSGNSGQATNAGPVYDEEPFLKGATESDL